MTGAKIIECDLCSDRMQLMKRVFGLFEVADQCRFGDFENNTTRIDTTVFHNFQADTTTLQLIYL